MVRACLTVSSCAERWFGVVRFSDPQLIAFLLRGKESDLSVILAGMMLLSDGLALVMGLTHGHDASVVKPIKKSLVFHLEPLVVSPLPDRMSGAIVMSLWVARQMSVECGSAQLPNFLLAMWAHFLFERDIAAVKCVCCVLDSCGASVLFFAHTRSSSCVYLSCFLCVLIRFHCVLL